MIQIFVKWCLKSTDLCICCQHCNKDAKEGDACGILKEYEPVLKKLFCIASSDSRHGKANCTKYQSRYTKIWYLKSKSAKWHSNSLSANLVTLSLAH
jgi:hypothetical protein